MKILFLCNFYPPYAIGGMEIICQSVVNGLTQRGHQCLVLTSYHGLNQPLIDGNIARQLHLEMKLTPLTNAFTFFFGRQKLCLENRTILRSWVEVFTPDIIFIWGMWNLHKILARDAEELMNGKVLYQFQDYWPALPSQYQLYWDKPGKTLPTRIIRRFIRPIAKLLLQNESDVKLDIKYSYCVSQGTKNHLIELGIPVENALVIPNGLDLSLFYQNPDPLTNPIHKLPKLLFVGRLQEVKGLHIVLDALKLLRQELPGINWKLTIIGPPDYEYLVKIRQFIENENLIAAVDFLGELPHSQIPLRMQDNGILIVPSIWDEPFAGVTIEGLAAGCLVIASNIGGLAEIIDHGNTGYLFTPGDSRQLADIIIDSLAHPQKVQEITQFARNNAIQQFSYEQMLDRVMQLLFDVIDQSTHLNSIDN